MGIVDFLKKVFPPGEDPLVGMEPQCVRYRWFTLRLPAGWHFTEADSRSFKATGPAGCMVDFFHASVASGEDGLKASAFEKKRDAVIKLFTKHFLEGKSTGETVLPSGVIWMEATDMVGSNRRVRIALLSPKSSLGDKIAPVLQATCTMPATAAANSIGAGQLEELRQALRSAEWN